jgi:hypothetical protein
MSRVASFFVSQKRRFRNPKHQPRSAIVVVAPLNPREGGNAQASSTARALRWLSQRRFISIPPLRVRLNLGNKSLLRGALAKLLAGDLSLVFREDKVAVQIMHLQPAEMFLHHTCHVRRAVAGFAFEYELSFNNHGQIR